MRKFAKITLVFLLFNLNFAHLHANQTFLLDALEKPSLLKVGQNNIYIVDGYKILVFSKTTKNLLYKIGKRGEGPGEFTHRPDSIQLLNDKILCSARYKLIYFSYQGKYLEEIKTPKSIRQLKKLKNGNYTGMQLIPGKTGISDLALNLYDKKFNLIKTFLTREYESKGAKIGLFVRFTRSPFHLDSTPKIIVFADFTKGFEININSMDGKLLHLIKRKHQLVEFTHDNQKEAVTCWTNIYRRKRIIDLLKISISFPRYFPPLCSWTIDQNKLYLITFNRIKNQNECFIYNLQGDFLKKTLIPLKSSCKIQYTWFPFDIYNNKFYQLNDNYQEESWELTITDLE